MRALFVCLLAAGWMSAQEPAQRVDQLFSRFSGSSPGCALGVMLDGKPVLAKAYGMADLEHGIPLSPDSPFYMASVSKQFTAMSILLLAEDGKLRVDDPVRKIIPELPDYASGITIYHLLTHTSGVRDYLSLGALAGRPAEFVFTDQSALALISRQKALNFQPGSEFLYSNSGYVLLSLVVKRLAQKNLNEYAQEKIFVPLGMKSTRFQHDHSALIPGKAFGYEQRNGDWHTSNSMLDVVGDGGLYSTVTDMLRWAANFDDPKIGAKALELMRTAAKLSTGKEVDYGMGLTPGDYRGLRIVEHGGGLGGYRTEVLWFPSERFTVVCLCNNGSANPGQLSRQVADAYLASSLKPRQATARRNLTGIALTPEERQAKAGLYRDEDRGYIEIVERDGKLYPRGAPGELIALDKHRFTASDAPEGWELVFDGEGAARSLELRSSGQPVIRYLGVATAALSEDERKAYAGEFASIELETTYRIRADSGGLSVEPGDRPAVRLQGAGKDRLRMENGGAELVFRRDSAGAVTGFSLNAGRVRRVEFQRM